MFAMFKVMSSEHFGDIYPHNRITEEGILC